MSNFNKDVFTDKDNDITRMTPAFGAFNSITAHWDTEGVDPSGILIFTVDGDIGVGKNYIDLSTGDRSLVCNAQLAFVNITASGLPDGSSVTLYFR